MSNPNIIRFSPALLRDYSIAALSNASELVAEALVLYTHGHFARAYFLAVASIEETGKAFLAFDGQGRNLSDSAVANKLKRTMEDHSKKISSAFAAWLVTSPNVRETVMPAVHLMIELTRGREPSMYTDIQPDSSSIQIPSTVVPEKAAFDCIRLATDCLSHTQRYILEKSPEPRTRAQDQLFAMKSAQFLKIANTEDFWWYFIEQSKGGRKDFAEAVMSYYENYARVGVLFGAPPRAD